MSAIWSPSRQNGHIADVAEGPSLTHNVTSPLSIDELRKLYSITSSVMVRRPGRSIKARQKAAFSNFTQ
jgi:hypothetical protein